MKSYDEEEKDRENHGLVWLSLWLFVLFWLFLPPKTQVVNIYRLGCPDVASTDKKCAQALVPTQSAYKVFIEQQFVVSKTTATKYDDCVVYDRKNWECRTPQMTIRMNKGKESIIAKPEGYPSVTAYAEASKALQDEETRNPQMAPWSWYIQKIRYELGLK